MIELEREKTEIPWPHWMLRYIGSDDQGAMEDLIWSVGGSPPYGGVSYDEAAAVYELIEAYRGPGTASPKAYARVESFIKGNPDRVIAIDIFRCVDWISTRRLPIAGAISQAREEPPFR